MKYDMSSHGKSLTNETICNRIYSDLEPCLEEEKIELDLEYINKMSFLFDVKIIFKTVWTAFFKQEGISQEGMDTAEDFGDWLLRAGKIDKTEYDEKQTEAKNMLRV